VRQLPDRVAILLAFVIVEVLPGDEEYSPGLRPEPWYLRGTPTAASNARLVVENPVMQGFLLRARQDSNLRPSVP